MSDLIVGDDFRTNPLSNEPGGHNIRVFFRTGERRVYTKVKRPKDYILNFEHTKLIIKVEIDRRLLWKLGMERDLRSQTKYML